MHTHTHTHTHIHTHTRIYFFRLVSWDQLEDPKGEKIEVWMVMGGWRDG